MRRVAMMVVDLGAFNVSGARGGVCVTALGGLIGRHDDLENVHGGRGDEAPREWMLGAWVVQRCPAGWAATRGGLRDEIDPGAWLWGAGKHCEMG